MATPNITDEEIQFRKRARRRLVGAIVLVLVVVVVVPWLLPADKPPQEAQEIDIRIPARDASGFAPRVQPATPRVGEGAASAGSAAAVPKAEPQPVVANAASNAVSPQETAPAEAQKSQAKPAQAKATEPKPAEAGPADVEKPQARSAPPKAAEAKPAAAGGERYYVQFGAFSSEKNAAQKQAEVKAKGISTFTEVVKTAAGDKIRVRSGPYPTRAAAEQIQQKAKPLESKLVPAGEPANGRT